MSKRVALLIAVLGLAPCGTRAEEGYSEPWIESSTGSYPSLILNPNPAQSVTAFASGAGTFAGSRAGLGLLSVATSDYGSGQASPAADADFGDWLTFLPASSDLYGQTGSFTFSLQDAGSLSSPPGGSTQGVAGALYRIDVNGLGWQGGTVQTDLSQGWNWRVSTPQLDAAGDHHYTSGFGTNWTGAPVEATVDFTWGQAFSLGVYLSAYSSVAGGTTDQQASASANQTLWWGGILGVFNQVGAAVSDYAVSSFSGVDYSKAASKPVPIVPEANAGLALIPFMAAILAFSSWRIWRSKKN
jgi:hypothetical protein